MQREMSFKKLAHAITGSGKTEICREGQKAGVQAGADVAVLIPMLCGGRMPSVSEDLSLIS